MVYRVVYPILRAEEVRDAEHKAPFKRLSRRRPPEGDEKRHEGDEGKRVEVELREAEYEQGPGKQRRQVRFKFYLSIFYARHGVILTFRVFLGKCKLHGSFCFI